MGERHDSAWWRNQYPGWPSMSRERMEMLFSDLAATEAERDEYRVSDKKMTDAAVVAINRAEKAEAEVKALREALEKYGEHRADCNADLSEGDDVYQCTCGLDALVKEETPCK